MLNKLSESESESESESYHVCSACTYSFLMIFTQELYSIILLQLRHRLLKSKYLMKLRTL